MSVIVQVLAGIGFCLYVALVIHSWFQKMEIHATSQNDVIDPNNLYQVGYLVGMTGGTVADAATVRYALERFEQTHGYKPTLRDGAIVVGIMNSMHSP